MALVINFVGFGSMWEEFFEIAIGVVGLAWVLTEREVYAWVIHLGI
jgi:hypothetical protein